MAMFERDSRCGLGVRAVFTERQNAKVVELVDRFVKYEIYSPSLKIISSFSISISQLTTHNQIKLLQKWLDKSNNYQKYDIVNNFLVHFQVKDKM